MHINPHNNERAMKDIFAELVKVRKKIRPVKKTSDGRTGNQMYKYADLSEIQEAIAFALEESAIDYTQVTWIEEDKVYVSTRLIHESGEMFHVEPPFSLPCAGLGTKDIGALITYARRYSLAPIFGVPVEDDDSVVPNKKPPKKTSQTQSTIAAPEYITDDQYDQLVGVVESCGYESCIATIERLRKAMKLKDIRRMPAHRFDNALKTIIDNAPKQAPGTED